LVQKEHEQEKLEMMRGKEEAEECICPECEFTVPKVIGMSCRKRKCPRCGSTMLSHLEDCAEELKNELWN
jgi:uncharacterized paraquat-inducible protein A